ncbi:MAG: glycosyltransferase family 4 protein [Planctomycetes bacterium]|nr:glycosyltransferase family 4 protein [Planctomycetota bacterium]
MKLLHVHDFYAPGNSRAGFDLDRILVRRGHEVHVLAAVSERGPADAALVEGVRFHTYPFRPDLTGRARYAWGILENRDRFEALQRDHGFDVLILNQPLCAAGVLRAPAARGLPWAYFFLSPWAAEWRIEHPDAGWFSRLVNAGFRGHLEGKALRAAPRAFVASEFMRGQLREQHPEIPVSRIDVIPGAVDLSRFRPEGTAEAARARFGIGPGPVILTVRRQVERMGIDLLLRAAATVPGVEVLLGGEGPHRARFEALARELGVRARFLGFVPDEDLPALYRAADLFVLPTRALEGFGFVAIEAMACGTPAMGTPVGAIPEVLGPLGLVFEAPTAEAIAAGIRRFFDARDASLPRRCRDHVAAKYDLEAVGALTEQLLQKVLH